MLYQADGGIKIPFSGGVKIEALDEVTDAQ
jgi:hypothetical protein